MGSPPRSKTALARLTAAPVSRACGKLAVIRETGHWLCSCRPCKLFQGGAVIATFAAALKRPLPALPNLLGRNQPCQTS